MIFRDTETTINNLIVPGGAFTLSNTSSLSHEIHPEKQTLYPQLLHSYKWNDKVGNFSVLDLFLPFLFLARKLQQQCLTNDGPKRHSSIVLQQQQQTKETIIGQFEF